MIVICLYLKIKCYNQIDRNNDIGYRNLIINIMIIKKLKFIL
jgi:hypothetical protein